jgi:hypothetical protein
MVMGTASDAGKSVDTDADGRTAFDRIADALEACVDMSRIVALAGVSLQIARFWDGALGEERVRENFRASPCLAIVWRSA